jgi:predicted permease
MTPRGAIRIAETSFRWLMLAYPPRFRRAHGLALFELFRDNARESYASRGARGLAAVVARAVLDAATSAPGCWFDRRTARPSSTYSTCTLEPDLPPLAVESGELGRGSPKRLRREGGQRTRPARPARLDLTSWLHDARVAARQLRKSPGFAFVAVLTLAVGIGANVTIFSIINAMLLRPLTADQPDRLVRIVGRAAIGTATRFSFRELEDLRERTTTLAGVAGANLHTFTMSADNRSDQLLGEIVSGGYHAMLGAAIAGGRGLTEADDAAGAAPAVVISDALWRRRFGGERVVGRQVVLNGIGYTVVGVAEPSFVGSFLGAPIDVWVPINTSGDALGANWRTDRSSRRLVLLGRLRPGVTPAQCESELQTIAVALAREFSPELRPVVNVIPGTLATGDQRRLARTFLTLVAGLVGLVLIIACANVGNLLLTRVVGRRRELAIRVALGASRGRLARMLAAESLMIAAAAGASAFLVSTWTSRIFSSVSPLPTLTLRFDVRPDARVVAFAALATLAAAAVLAAVGTLQAARPNVGPALSEESAAAIGGRTPTRLRGALATVQITVSLLLLVGAGLFLRSVRHAAAIDLGFDPRGVLALDLDSPEGRAPAASAAILETVVDRLASIPGIQTVSLATRAPLDSSTPRVRVNARDPVPVAADAASSTASFMVVGPQYFDVVKTPLADGRAFDARDVVGQPLAAIVNETLAARLWPEGDALGRRLWLEPHITKSPLTVIGVAKDSKYSTLGEERQNHVFLPFGQHPQSSATLLIRSSIAPAGPDGLINTAQKTLQAVDSNLRGFFPRTLIEHVAVSTLPVRLAAGLASSVGALALGLAILGLYALVSFVVAERTHEIGLRMALGADRRHLLRLVLGYGVRLAAMGLAIGVPVALAASRLLASLLYGVGVADPAVFFAVPLIILGVSLAACYVPARRAMRLDPLTALRRP